MNSSANQISPIAHHRERCRVWPKFLRTWQVFPDALIPRRLNSRLLDSKTLGSPVSGLPPPAGNMPSLPWFRQGGKLGIGQSKHVADSPIVELHRCPIN